jgi:hypothetical protein
MVKEKVQPRMKCVYAETYRRLIMLVLVDYGLNLLPTEVCHM